MAISILDRIKRTLGPIVIPVFAVDDDPPVLEDGDARPARMNKTNGGVVVHVANAADIGGGGGGGAVDQGVGSAAPSDAWGVRPTNAAGSAFVDLALESTSAAIRSAVEAVRDRLPSALVTPGDTDANAGLLGVVGRLQLWTGTQWVRARGLTTLGHFIVSGGAADGAGRSGNPVPMGVSEGGGSMRFARGDAQGRQAVWAERVARASHLASAALPAAGAYTTQALHTVPDGVRDVTFWITYAWGAAGGQAAFFLEYSNGTETAAREVVASSTTVAAPIAREATQFRQIDGPIPDTEVAILFCLEVRLPAGTTGVRLRAAEIGVTATPGTCAIAISSAYGAS